MITSFLTVGCSDEAEVYDSGSSGADMRTYNAAGAEFVEVGYTPDMEMMAGDMPPEPTVDTRCVIYALSPNRSSEEVYSALEQGEGVCLDDLNFKNDWCDREEEISEVINGYIADPNKSIACVDQDEDCYYQCADWLLVEGLADPDERRETIPSDHSARMQLERMISGMHGENGGGDFHIPPELTTYVGSSLLCKETTNDSEGAARPVEGSACLYTFGGAPIENLWTCEGDGIAWLSAEAGPKELHLGALTYDDQEFDSRVKLEIDFTPSDIACFRTSESAWSMILTDESQAQVLYYDANDDSLKPFSLSEEQLALLGPNMLSSIDQLSVDSSGFQTWRFNAQLDGPVTEPSMIGMRLKSTSPAYLKLPRGVIDQRFSCLDCSSSAPSPRAVYLRDDLSVTITESLGGLEEFSEGLTLFESYGPFEAIMASESLLGLVTDQEQSEQIYFSLWTEPLFDDDSLLNFPLIFDATEQGYESVELIDIKGMNALLRLAEPPIQGGDSPEPKRVFAVYNVLTDNLIDVESELSTASLLETGVSFNPNEIEWSRPLLHNTWVSRLAKAGDQNYVFVVKLAE